MKKKISALLIGVVFVLAACGGSEETAKTDATDKAKNPEQLYMQKCSSCHGGELQGSGSAIPNLQKVWSRLSAEEIQDIIENGKGAMAGGYLKGEDAKVVAEWLAEQK